MRAGGAFLAALLLSLPLLATVRAVSDATNSLDSAPAAANTGPGRALNALPAVPAIAARFGMSLAAWQALAVALDKTAEYVEQLLSAGNYQKSQPQEGATWISTTSGSWGTWSGRVVSAYYHPTKSHSATTVGKLGTKQSNVKAGEWAISQQPRALWGNKAYYNTKD